MNNVLCVGGPLDGQEIVYQGKRLTARPEGKKPVGYVLRRYSRPAAGLDNDGRRSRVVEFRYELELARGDRSLIPSRWNSRRVNGKPTHV